MSTEWIVPPQWIVPQWPAPPRVRALSTTRHGGVSGGSCASLNIGIAVGDDPALVAANRARLRAVLPGEPVWLTQVHGTCVFDVDLGGAASASPLVQADASMTRSTGRVLAIQSADCLPVLLADRAGSVIAAAHAGWRGLSAGVIENAVAAMCVPPSDIVAWLGPAIGPAAYEVGQDVFDAFVAREAAASAAFRPREMEDRTDQSGGNKYLVDLYALARQRLARLGVPSVSGGGYCTHTDHDRFFSYRRDNKSGRMATLIWIEK